MPQATSQMSRLIRSAYREQRRHDKTLTKYRLAQITGVKESTLNRILNGLVDPSAANAETLLDYFGFVIVRKGTR